MFQNNSFQIQGEEYQWTLIGKYGSTDKYFFKNFTKGSEVFDYVVNMSKGDNLVHKIVRMYLDGDTVEYTIGFKEGKFVLIQVHPQMQR